MEDMRHHTPQPPNAQASADRDMGKPQMNAITKSLPPQTEGETNFAYLCRLADIYDTSSCPPKREDGENEAAYKARLTEHFNRQTMETLGLDMTPRINSVRDYPRAFAALAATMVVAGALTGCPGLATLYVVAKATTLLMQHDRNMAAEKKRRDAQNFLFYHAKTGNLAEMKKCLRRGADINAWHLPNKDHLVYTEHGICIRDEYYDYRYTMQKADIGKTALILAAENGHEHLVYALVAQGANRSLRFNTQKATCMVTAMHHHKDTAADFARKNGHTDIANWLDSLDKPLQTQKPLPFPKPPSPHAG
ncbi:MAG: hypothetical protein A2018_02990 [Alphaproteobacteria bacterium GWF2_58_20]|nr:MAG: hypothetical protein A2018_02990 [Alphaproteobacteria bacterium GWF2_58_20]